MREPRIFVDKDLQCGDTTTLPADASHHLGRVLRMRVQQRLRLFNGRGGSYLAELVLVAKRQVDVRVLDFCDGEKESPLTITLVQGVSRSQHMDYTLQKAVELGVGRIVPVITDHGNVALDEQRAQKKRLHWQRTVVGACEQCGRNTLPQIDTPLLLADWLELDRNRTRLILHPGESRRLTDIEPDDGRLSLLSGPEGGFSPLELELARAQGYLVVSLGPRVLRTETAAVAAITACQVLWGDMG